jgi:hypothetical protein
MKQKKAVMLMRSAIFRQYDTKWGSLKYPKGKYTMSRSGCGCCACTHLIIEHDKYKDYTPKNVRPYMVNQGFATEGNGTLWSGITKTLEHYGFKVKRPNISTSMTPAWNELNKGHRAGILLFKAGSRGSVTWTSGGHYVAFLNYKVEGGKHYFYTKDSGARKNDGWHCYETTMKGLLPQIWIVELPEYNDTYYSVGKKYTLQDDMNVRSGANTTYKKVGTLKKGTKIECLQTSLNGKWIRYGKGKWVCGRGATKVYIK